MWFLCCFRHTRHFDSGLFRNLIQFFQPLMFVVVTIKDLKYNLQHDELISLLMFVTLGPAYLYNFVTGCCVSHHGVWSIDPFFPYFLRVVHFRGSPLG